MFSTAIHPEYNVFRKKYSALVDTLKTTDLSRYFVSEEVITLADKEEISAESNPTEKVEMMLSKISSPLQSGHTKSFYVMLKVMASYGNRATKELARNINDTLHGSVSDDGKMYIICKQRTHIHLVCMHLNYCCVYMWQCCMLERIHIQ